jgi:Integrase repeat unit
VRKLGLKNLDEWREYCVSEKRPPDIPTNPNVMYADAGWINMGDWLGTGNVSWREVKFRSFKEARAFVRKLGIKSKDQWYDYCKTGKKPDDIPSNLDNTYRDDWTGWPAFLGTDNRGAKIDWRPFKEARAFVRRLKLRSQADWSVYCQSGKRPRDIPAIPSRAYAMSGWVSWGDWFGSGRVQNGSIEYRSFKDARSFVRKLGLASQAQWIERWRSNKTQDIPSNPAVIYRNKGWAGWSDFLGKIN